MGNIDETTVTKWSEIFVDWQKSGESQRGYCRINGISYSAFGYWRKRLDGLQLEPKFVRIEGTAIADATAARTTVRCNRVEVELTGQETEGFLGRLFRSLEWTVCL